MIAWFMECLVQIVMAVNRFTVITLNNKTFFTFTSTMIIFVILFSITIFSAVCVQYLFPCCRFIADTHIMSYMLVNVDGLYSYSNAMVVAYDVICTSTPTLCYMSVLFSIRKSNKLAPANVAANRSNQEVKYLIQFVFISIFYICTWVFFETLPYIVPADQPEWFAVVAVSIACNCSSHPIIYLSTNPEVQRTLQVPWIRDRLVRGQGSTTAAVVNPPINPTN